MGGQEYNIAPMWVFLGENGIGGLILDPPTTLTGNVYLGSEQTDVKNDTHMIKEKRICSITW